MKLLVFFLALLCYLLNLLITNSGQNDKTPIFVLFSVNQKTKNKVKEWIAVFFS